MELTRDELVPSALAGYGLEVLCASWNPLAATMTELAGAGREPVAEHAAADVEGFLAIFYRSQQG